MAASGGQLGVTGPLSLALPTDADRRATEALVDELKRQNNYESATETNKRYVTRHPTLFSPPLILLAMDGVQSADTIFLLDWPSSTPFNKSLKSSLDMLGRRKVYPTVL
jgi:hypothetical protein